MNLSKKINQATQQEDWENFNKAPYESAKKEALKIFLDHREEIKEEIDIFSKALEEKFANPLTDDGRKIKQEIERFLQEDKTALEWIENQADDAAILKIIAARLDRFADFSLSFAKMALGSERVGEEIKGLTETEQLSIEEAGRVSYSANILRNHEKE